MKPGMSMGPCMTSSPGASLNAGYGFPSAKKAPRRKDAGLSARLRLGTKKRAGKPIPRSRRLRFRLLGSLCYLIAMAAVADISPTISPEKNFHPPLEALFF